LNPVEDGTDVADGHHVGELYRHGRTPYKNKAVILPRL
jgi:hypothetical protein